MEQYILLALTTIIFIMAVFYLYKGIKYNKQENDEKIRSNARQDVIWGTFLLLTTVFLLVYIYYLEPRDAAHKLLDAKDNKEEFNELCESLFKLKSDEKMYNQYLDMKNTRPQSEINNLCGNFAKTILNIK
jgi:hypothetical protein